MDFSKIKKAIAWLEKVNEQNFEAKALELFYWQAKNCSIYTQYLDLLNIEINSIDRINQIPFLPIQFFKTHSVKAKNKKVQLQFESSGTTGQVRSKHSVTHPEIYHWTGLDGFKENFGNIDEWNILALLPSYLERNNASLVYMCQQWIENSKSGYSGFYLDNLEVLHKILQTLLAKNEKVLLMGVSFALLDLAEQFPMDLSKAVVMETGGMKGRRKEMIRAELHHILKAAFQTDKIYSEYGMTELLSQAYTKGGDLFYPPNYMRVLARNHTDPFEIHTEGNGALNVIDLANIYSCAFIETQDLGHVNTDLSFEVKGRMDISEVRGCNLMIG
jgi:hypothetical protein